MATSSFKQTWKGRPPRRQRLRDRVAPAVIESLDRRVLLAVTATLAAGTLFITGDDQDNSISVSRDAGGAIFVNNGAIAITGGPANIGNTNHLHLVGAGGNDILALDEANGPMPGSALFGGAGNDILAGGADADFADGGSGADSVFLGGGDDTFQWNPGDGSDLVEGQGGSDAIVFNGSVDAEHFSISSNVNRVLLTRDVGNVTMDVGGLEIIDLNPLGGADDVTINDLSATVLTAVNLDLGLAGLGDGQADAVIFNGAVGEDLLQIASFDNGGRVAIAGNAFPFVSITGAEAANDRLTVNTLGGNDVVDAGSLAANAIGLTLNGGAGNDELLAGGGDDLVNGGAGDDEVFLESGNDTFVWNPGDGNDTIEGMAGADTLIFNGAPTPETINLSSNNGRLRLNRATDDIVLDSSGVEQLDINTGHLSDVITVGDLSDTDLATLKLNVDPDPQNQLGGAAVDRVDIDGTAGDDNIQIIRIAGGYFVSGLATLITVDGIAADLLFVRALAGNDVVNAPSIPANVLLLVIDGGSGNDSLRGGQGNDAVIGGAGDDVVLLQGGDDSFLWKPGDGNDTVEGEAGRDDIVFNGSNAAEQFGVSASADRISLTRDLESVTLDLGGVELLNLNPLGGADAITFNDLSGAGVDEINLNLSATAGGNIGDTLGDSVIVHGTAAGDLIPLLGNSDGILVNGDFLTPSGLPYFMLIRAVETIDDLQINGDGGNDTITANTLETAVKLSIDGGIGNDTLTGSHGADTLLVGNGNDLIEGNGGGDHLSIDAGVAALASTQKFASLSISDDGALDIRDHSLIVDYDSTSPIGFFAGSSYTGLTGLVQSGAIVSSSDTGALTSIGVAEASDVAPGGTFAGQSVDASAVLVKFTYAGDANLDGKINIDDYGRIDGNVAQSGSVFGWFNGDFNLDGKINIDDYGIIDGNVNQQDEIL